MSAIMNAQQFNIAVYGVVSQIPEQHITSCGHIAMLIGAPKQARRVREAVNLMSLSSSPVPCHRVVSNAGILTTRGSFASTHHELLKNEGIDVQVGEFGESRVEFEKYGWFPDHLESDSEEDGRAFIGNVGSDSESEEDWAA